MASSIARCTYSQPIPRVLLWACAIAGDVVTDAIEFAELLDVDVDDLAGSCAFVATDRLGRLERRKLIETQSLQDAADGGGRNPDLRGDLLAGVMLASQTFDGGALGWRRLAWR